METDPRLLLLSPEDNVFVLRATIDANETIFVSGEKVRFARRIGLGHKVARRAISRGEKVMKYGASIVSATCDIAPGEHVHLDNLQSDYTPTYSLSAAKAAHGEREP